MGEKAWRFLTSVRLALVLITLLTVTGLLGAIAGRRVFSTWPFLLLVVSLGLNLTACTMLQYGRAWRRWRSRAMEKLPERGFASPSDPGAQDAILPAAIAGEVPGRSSLQGIRRRIIVQGGAVAGEVPARISRSPLWLFGSPLFHTGLLVILVGGFITAGWSSYGAFGVIEGDAFVDRPAVTFGPGGSRAPLAGDSPIDGYVTYHQGRLAGARGSRFTLRLNRVDFQRGVGGKVEDYLADISFLEGKREVKRTVLSGVGPVNFAGLDFYQKTYGYAPAFILRRSDGREVSRFLLALESDFSGGLSPGWHYGQGNLPGAPYQVRVNFFPAPAESGGSGGSPDDAPAATVATARGDSLGSAGGTTRMGESGARVHLEVQRGQERVYDGELAVGQKAGFAGYSLEFHHYRLWYGFTAKYDPGVPWVYSGFLLGLTGLILVFALPDSHSRPNKTKKG